MVIDESALVGCMPTPGSWPRHDGTPPAPGADFLVPPDPGIGLVRSAETNRTATGFLPMDAVFRKTRVEFGLVGLLLGWSAAAALRGGEARAVLPWSSVLTLGEKSIVLAAAIVAGLAAVGLTMLLRPRRASFVGTAGLQTRTESLWGGGRTELVRFSECAELRVEETRLLVYGKHNRTTFRHGFFDPEGQPRFLITGQFDERAPTQRSDQRRFAVAAEQAWNAWKRASPGAGRPVNRATASTPASPSDRVLVTLRSMTFSLPRGCAGCGAPAAATIAATRRVTIGRLRRSIPIPHCLACAARARSVRWNRTRWALGTVALAAGLGLFGFVAPDWPLGVQVALTTGAAALVAWLGARRPPRGEPVRLVAFDGFFSRLLCENPAWAGELASLNGGVPVPAASSVGVDRRPVVLACIVAPLATMAVWLSMHRPVVVDHAGNAPVTIWIDGRAVEDVAPRPRWGRPPRIWVALGQHAFGASRRGAPGPAGVVEGDVVRGAGHLYNPGATACYVTQGPGETPQPLAELHRFPPVASWFVEDGERGANAAVRRADGEVAVERDPECRMLLSRGCDRAAVERLLDCRRAAADPASARTCVTDGCPKSKVP